MGERTRWNASAAEASAAPPGGAYRWRGLPLALPRHAQLALVALSGALFTLVVFRNAWLNDDAYITFRTVDNFIRGDGLTWNPAERVQAYTHPLWMFALSLAYLFTHEAFFTSLALSMALSLAAVLLIGLRIAPSTPAALAGIAILIGSKAYVDYSTSGLENPLTHLLVALFLLVYLRWPDKPRHLFVLAGIAALVMLTRTDLIVLLLPALVYAALRPRRWSAVVAVVAGFIPFALWEAFSLFYYGFLFPNTAYAKLNTGISQRELVEQGLYYLLNSIRIDPLTLMVIAAGVAAPLVARNWRQAAVSAGMLLYLAYVVRIGGDFMSGRFLTAPLLCAAIVLVCQRWPAPAYLLAAGVATAVSLASPYPPLFSGESFSLNRPYQEIKDEHGVADERGIYYQATGLLKILRDPASFDHVYIQEGRQLAAEGPTVTVQSSIGFIGYFAGRDAHIVDMFALADPLLARLPASENKDWRIGHFKRVIPYGYVRTLTSGENEIDDKRLARYYDKLALVTRGDLFDLNRLVEIWNFNTGKYDHLINFNVYRFADARLRRNRD
jgi:arabinofuranosyltransferase